MKMILRRLKEPSTWVAIGGVLTAFGISVEPGTMEQIGTGIAAACAFIAGMAMPEKGEQP